LTKDTITKRQAICIIALYLLGSFVIANLSPQAEQDTWFSILMAAIGFVPLLLVYARLIKLHPGKDIFQTIETLFGRLVSKVFIVLLFWYSVHLCSLVIRNFSEFIEIVSMPETPQLPIMIIMMLLAAYIAKSGPECLGKWSVIVLPIVAFIVILTVFLSINKMDLTNIQPVLVHDIGALSNGAFSFFAFPFAETLLFLGVANAIKKTDSPRGIYLWSISIGLILMLIALVRNIEVLGVPMMKAEYFPSYMSVRIINIGDVITRIEGSISVNFILTGFTKVTLCLLFASKGAASLFGVKDYRKLVIPVGLLAVGLASIVYKSTMEMFEFVKVYAYYALPFQVVIPLIIWITAEIKVKKAKKTQRQEGEKAGGAPA
jgi:spore germination protein KB